MKNRLFRYLMLISIFLPTISYAGGPLWTFTPLTPTTVSVADGQTETIQYLVTNQSSRSHTLAMTPIAGVTQITSGVGICGNPFTLPQGGDPSCTLSLSVNGSTLPGNVTGGPVVCQQGSSLQCYQPSIASQLNITKTDGATISLTNSPLTLTTNGSDGTMIITNTSMNETALNIAANLSSTALQGKVSVTGNCSTLAPQASCTLTFTPGSSSVSETSFPIQGTNTNAVMGAITISAPAIHIIFVTNSQYQGDLGGFSGADAKCNADSAKPSTGFAAEYTYKALLDGNNATTNGIRYYRPDGTTTIATATGGNLVGVNDLEHSISTNNFPVWTGGNGIENCESWTTSLFLVGGSYGISNLSDSQYYEVPSDPDTTLCNNSFYLYCVSQ